MNTTDTNYDIDFAQEGLTHVERIKDFYLECKQIDAKVEVVKEMAKVEIAKIAYRYKAQEIFLKEVFTQRSEALAKIYDALDYGVASGNTAVIVAAMQEISGIVTSSPLEDLERFAALYEDTSQPLLDF